jgi:hypothetical protein
VGGYEGWLNSSEISPSYLDKTGQMTKPIDCMWIVNVTEGWKVGEASHVFTCLLVSIVFVLYLFIARRRDNRIDARGISWEGVTGLIWLRIGTSGGLL